MNQTEAGPVEAAQKIPPGGRKSESHLQEGNAGRAPWFVRAFKLVVRAIFRLFFRVKVTGLKNVPSTPVIVCANHLGWTDTFLVLLFFPLEPRMYVLGEQRIAALLPVQSIHHPGREGKLTRVTARPPPSLGARASCPPGLLAANF